MCVDAIDKFPTGVTRNAMDQMLGCIASYRAICHQLAPLLHDAIAREEHPQRLADLREALKQLQRGES